MPRVQVHQKRRLDLLEELQTNSTLRGGKEKKDPDANLIFGGGIQTGSVFSRLAQKVALTKLSSSFHSQALITAAASVGLVSYYLCSHMLPATRAN